MNSFFIKNLEKIKIFALFLLVSLAFFIFSYFYKNDQTAAKNVLERNINIENNKDLTTIKEFFFKKIKSPFINIAHEIKPGDTIGKILKKQKVKNNQIQNVINEYKKYGKSNRLLVGNKIELVIEKNFKGEKNSIARFFIPLTKSIPKL